jgi:hypothetical protein
MHPEDQQALIPVKDEINDRYSNFMLLYKREDGKLLLLRDSTTLHIKAT